jgi:hypothetical protein
MAKARETFDCNPQGWRRKGNLNDSKFVGLLEEAHWAAARRPAPRAAAALPQRPQDLVDAIIETLYGQSLALAMRNFSPHWRGEGGRPSFVTGRPTTVAGRKQLRTIAAAAAARVATCNWGIVKGRSRSARVPAHITLWRRLSLICDEMSFKSNNSTPKRILTIRHFRAAPYVWLLWLLSYLLHILTVC